MLGGIADAAESIGFKTNGVKITFKQLVSEKPLPCILHWNQNHFVICYSIKQKKNDDYEVKISNPVGEKYTLNKTEFLKCWISSVSEGEDTGTVLLLEPTLDFYTQDDGLENSGKSISYFFRYLRPYRSQIVQLIIGLLVGNILPSSFHYLYRQ